MRIDEISRLLTPGDIETLKQKYRTERDGYNALFEELFGRHLEGHNKDEIRDALAAYFDRLTAHHG